MKQCPVCGKEVEDARSECPDCGTPLPNDAAGLLGSMGKIRKHTPAPREETPKPEASEAAPAGLMGNLGKIRNYAAPKEEVPEKPAPKAPAPAAAPTGLVGSLGSIHAYAAPEPDSPEPRPEAARPVPGPETAAEPEAVPEQEETAWEIPVPTPVRVPRRASRRAAPAPVAAPRPAKPQKSLSPAAEWTKYILMMLIILAFAIVTVSVVKRDLREAELDREGSLFTVEEARRELTAAGFALEQEDLMVDSQPDEFYYQARLVKEEYPFLTVSGVVDYTARYSTENKVWHTSYEPKRQYDWNLTGQWFAQTENYYVYLTVLDFDGERIHAILEARYDSGDGGLNSCGATEQTCTMTMEYPEGNDAALPQLVCRISGGYPEFNMVLTANELRIWQQGDSVQVVFTPLDYPEG
jgi:hypothetical protein